MANDARIATPMEALTTPDGIRGARPTKNKATKTLRAAGVTFAEVGKELGVPYSTARAWFQTGGGGRAVPRKHAVTLERRYGIKPADLPNGIVEGK